MPSSGLISSRKVYVTIDLRNPFLNKTFDGFFKIGTKHPGSLLEGFSQTQVSTLAVKDKLLVAGGFQENLYARLGSSFNQIPLHNHAPS